MRPCADQRTHSTHLHRDASAVGGLFLHPFAENFRVPNAMNLFPAGNECRDILQKTQVEVLIRVDISVSQNIQRDNRLCFGDPDW